jgi:CubicO group peptidase (beta-lactamase class C family)
MTGWEGDFFVDTGSGDDALAKYVARMAGQEQLAPFNTIWSYNNAGFSLAGYIVEQVTGQSYETVLQELVLDPLRLHDTYLNPTDVMTHSFAVGHEIKEGEAQVARPWPLPRAVGPAGGIISTVEDLLRYADFHMGDGTTASGERLLSSELLRAMHTQQVAIGGGHEAMALTWFINHVAGVRHLSHAGATLGQIALLMWVPDHHFALAILTNADRGRRATREISRLVLKEYLGLETVDPAPLALSEAELRPYAGRYVRPFAEVTLALQDGQLVLSPVQKGSFPSEVVPVPPPPPPMPVAPYHPDYLIVLEGDSKTVRAEIIRRPDGSIGWLRWGSRIHEKVS